MKRSMRLLLDLTKREASLIISKDILALSTVSQHGWPHCVPVSYVYLNGKFYIPASSKSKKIRNLRQNHCATILMDDAEIESGVMMECEPKILIGAKAKKFREYVRRVKGWQSDATTVIIVLTPLRKASWFLKSRKVRPF
ncbi:MAG TPA: pyridoxamine 5'-phosphate oxidase family protein [Candidatus Bathyarchaeia archaeon]|nr:pyridoxamine 5'-phosphate oxidase family protein [Candidatus Bathyarchaeia archaeon]